jgi:hypothetical protein
MAYSMTLRTTIMFGGYGDANGSVYGDTWQWDGSGTWTQLAIPGPTPRDFHAMVYDSGRDVIVLFGGADGVSINGETWELVPCPADFNRSGSVGIQDIFDFLNAWFAGDASADFNHVNGLTEQDIFDFLSSWFAGC